MVNYYVKLFLFVINTKKYEALLREKLKLVQNKISRLQLIL